MIEKLRRIAESVVTGRKRRQPEPEPAPEHPILSQIQTLPSRQHRELACAVSMLWDSFVDEVGGVAGFRARSEAHRASYIQTMKHSAHRVRENASPEAAHYALAPELMVLYAESLGRSEHSKLDLEVARIASHLATKGALIRKAGRKPGAAVGASRLNAALAEVA